MTKATKISTTKKIVKLNFYRVFGVKKLNWATVPVYNSRKKIHLQIMNLALFKKGVKNRDLWSVLSNTVSDENYDMKKKGEGKKLRLYYKSLGA